jgi:hypothetical protein
MKFQELETKEKFDNKFGKASSISSYCYYDGSEQISIYIKTGFGASEKTINEVISEHELDSWLKDFKTNPTINTPKKMENPKPLDFNTLRQKLAEVIDGVKDGSVQIEKAKTISALSQVMINTVKVEIDYLKVSGSKTKPTMIP